eukprot:COSAG02_NODE_22779_length_740_cov_2.310452_1_plen_24_part_01
MEKRLENGQGRRSFRLWAWNPDHS